MRIDELDEFQGLTPDMVRQWLSATGQPERACPNYQVCVHLGTHTHHGIAPMDFSVAEDWSGHWQRVNLLSVALWYLAAKQAKSMQAILREINPRMRKGWPSDEAIAATKKWVAKHPKGVIFVGEILNDPERGPGLAVSLTTRLDKSQADGWSFWPCDEYGNKVRWPTDAEGKML